MSDLPDEPAEGQPGPHGGGPDDVDADADAPLRGWIDPDDRLWRHPSEVAAAPGSGSAPGSAGAPAGLPDTGPITITPPVKHPYRNVAMVLIGIGAAFAVVAWVVVLLSPSSQRPLSGATRDISAPAPTTLAGAQNAVPAVAEAAGRSMVQLVATTAHGSVSLVGIAVAEGGLVVTTADMLRGLERIDMVGAGGKLERATLTATDSTSDIALVTVPEDVPVAPFADDNALSGGAPDYVLSFVSAGGGQLALHCTPGALGGVGTAVGDGPADGMGAITASAPTTPYAGQPLLNQSGQVLGLLYEPGDSTQAANGGALSTFLPTQLVVGVADDLRSRARVVHGWLGVDGTDAAGPAGAGAGAKVVTVDAKGPAAGRLQPGQVIVGLNNQPVRTMAELRARLYVLPPGAPVAVSVQAPGGAHVMNVTLSASS